MSNGHARGLTFGALCPKPPCRYGARRVPGYATYHVERLDAMFSVYRGGPNTMFLGGPSVEILVADV
jgi:hypothetical protein